MSSHNFISNETIDSENLKEIENFEALLKKTAKLTEKNKTLFFKDKSLLLEQTRTLQIKCKHLREDENNSKKHRSKSVISQLCNEPFDANLSFCQKSHRTDNTNFAESKYSDPSNLPLVKNPLKFSNASSILHNNNNENDDLSTTIPHSFYEKASESNKTYNCQTYEKKIESLEEKIKELRLELGKKEGEINNLKKGLLNSKGDLMRFLILCNRKKSGSRNFSTISKRRKKIMRLK